MQKSLASVPYYIILVLLLVLVLGVAPRAYAENTDPVTDPLESIMFYKPNYFIFIHDIEDGAWEAKYQFSIKVNILPLKLGSENGLHFGYTQKSFWDIFETSSPFRSSNYNPELFYAYSFKQNKVLNAVQAGVEHESNGEAGLTSRAWNKVYFEIEKKFKVPRLSYPHQASFTPRVWSPAFLKGDNNDDIHDFLSYWQLRLVLEDKDRKKSFGIEAREHSVQLDISFRPWKKQNLYWYLQYWNGYGEGLSTYNRRTQRLGFGVSFIKW